MANEFGRRLRAAGVALMVAGGVSVLCPMAAAAEGTAGTGESVEVAVPSSSTSTTSTSTTSTSTTSTSTT